MSTTINGSATPISPEAFAALAGPEAIQDFGAGVAGPTSLASKLEDPEQSKSFLKRHAKALVLTVGGLIALAGGVWRTKAANAALETAVKAFTGSKEELTWAKKAGAWAKAFVGREASIATKAGAGAAGAGAAGAGAAGAETASAASAAGAGSV
ncbi:MAG: hypothetical protein IPK13_03970 [Deltaproteobacteria bacterium]|nr:hypothetical protein [Deltaproteobacteria bacterium]